MKPDDLVLPHGTRPPRRALLDARWLIYAGIVAVNVISWVMTSQGFILSGYMPMDGLVPGEWIPRTLVACSQLFIAFFFLEVPRTRIVAATGCILTILAIIGLANLFFEVFFSMASVSERARGGAYLSDVTNRVKAVAAKVSDVDDQMVNTFTNQAKELEQLARDAATGRDRTGVAKCGEICRGFWESAHRVRQNYAALGIPLGTGSAETDDVNRLWLATKIRVQRLKQKAESFATFLAGEELDAYGIAPLVEGLGKEADAVEETFFAGKGILDTKSLVLNHTFAGMKDVLFLRATERSVYIGFFAAILPIMIHLGLWLLLALRKINVSAIGELSRARADLEERSGLLQEILDLQTKVGMAEVTLDQKKSWWQQFRDAMRKAREKIH